MQGARDFSIVQLLILSSEANLEFLGPLLSSGKCSQVINYPFVRVALKTEVQFKVIKAIPLGIFWVIWFGRHRRFFDSVETTIERPNTSG